MLTGVAVMRTMPRYMPYGWVFVVAVIALILLIFIRAYVIGGRSRRRIAHRSRRRAGHRSG
jgi:VIT1/CCC1 family predicted Fe2+/Mn2+ transporter